MMYVFADKEKFNCADCESNGYLKELNRCPREYPPAKSPLFYIGGEAAYQCPLGGFYDYENFKRVADAIKYGVCDVAHWNALDVEMGFFLNDLEAGLERSCKNNH